MTPPGLRGDRTVVMVALVLTAVALVGVGTGFLVGLAGTGSRGGSTSPQPAGPPSRGGTEGPAAPSPSGSRTDQPSGRPTTRADSDVERGRTSDLGYFLGADQRPDGLHVTFDRALLFFGDEARRVAKDRGLTSQVRHGALLVNQNPLTRDMVLAPDVRILGGRLLAGSQEPEPVPTEKLLSTVATRGEDVLLDLRYDRLGYVVEVRERELP